MWRVFLFVIMLTMIDCAVQLEQIDSRLAHAGYACGYDYDC